MSRMSVFNSPFLLGFEQFERTIDRISKLSTETYPPYNIEEVGGNCLRITLAVAGFALDHLNIVVEDNQLIIRGRQVTENEGTIFLHRGIAARQFERAFVLAEGIEVAGASLDKGLLHIDLNLPMPENRSRSIEISMGAPDGGDGTATVDLQPAKPGL